MSASYLSNHDSSELSKPAHGAQHRGLVANFAGSEESHHLLPYRYAHGQPNEPLGGHRFDSEPIPPNSNTGGKSCGRPQVAIVDWLGFTLRLASADRSDAIEYLGEQLEKLFNLPKMDFELSGRGWYGYLNRVDLGGYGILAYGGESQQNTYHIELNGRACARVTDWEKIANWGERLEAWITRSDLAHDDHDGQTVTIQRSIEWYEAGGFTSGGRPPKRHLHYDFESGDGKTFQVGERKNGKYCRGYEKGKEQGDPSSRWVRIEVERRNKSRVIPWDVVTNPGDYLASCYPCLQFLSPVQRRIQTIQRSATINYQQMVAWLHMAGGKALGVMLQVHEGDASAVLAKLVRKGVPRRLQPFEDFRLVELLEDAT